MVLGLGLCALVLAANFAGVYVITLLISWNKAFFDALQNVAVEETVRQVGVFFVLILTSAALFLIGQYLRKLVYIRWRRRLNSIALDAWLENQAYWRLQPSILGQLADNPDQRIAEDCRMFVDKLLELSVELITKIVALFTFLLVLWELSSFPLTFSVFDTQIVIPRYMVWAAFLYVALSSWLTHVLGAPLKNLLFLQQRREADYRFALARMRDFSDEIALSRGEAAERRIFDQRFSAIVANWHSVITREFILGCFTRPYFQTVLRIPLFLALPAYLAGQVTLGGLMQVRGAFSSVVTTLSWFIFNYRELAEWVATTDRLAEMLSCTEHARKVDSGIELTENTLPQLAITGLRLTTPQGAPLDVPPDLTIDSGERIWIKGQSGLGKSTLIKAIAGLWLHGSGHIKHPPGWRPAFVSQDIYLPLSDFRSAAIYPLEPTSLDQSQVDTALQRIGLELPQTAHCVETPSAPSGLSGGERQRLAFSRLLLSAPDWIFLDETTNALDPKSEEQLLQTLIYALPQMTLVFVSHKPPPAIAGETPWRVIDLQRVLVD